MKNQKPASAEERNVKWYEGYAMGQKMLVTKLVKEVLRDQVQFAKELYVKAANRAATFPQGSKENLMWSHYAEGLRQSLMLIECMGAPESTYKNFINSSVPLNLLDY